jgi:hypothetical protein
MLGVGVTIVGNWATANQPGWLESLLSKHQGTVWIGLGALALITCAPSVLVGRTANTQENAVVAAVVKAGA